MRTGLLTHEASFRTSVEDRARAKAMKTAIVLGTALMMFIATIGLNVWLSCFPLISRALSPLMATFIVRSGERR